MIIWRKKPKYTQSKLTDAVSGHTCVILSTGVGMPSMTRGGSSCREGLSGCGTGACCASAASRSCMTTPRQFRTYNHITKTSQTEKTTSNSSVQKLESALQILPAYHPESSYFYNYNHRNM